MKRNKLTLIQINDAHGYYAPHKEVFFETEGFQVREAGATPGSRPWWTASGPRAKTASS